MGLRYKFKKAIRIVDNLSPADRVVLERKCRLIQAAEDELLKRAEENMVRCLTGCEGLCCRNAQFDDIISHWDFVFLLTVEKDLRQKISECLEKEIPFFSADCLFLENGKGPCIFPAHSRPEICITTFCGSDQKIKKEISKVKSGFLRMTWFVMLRKPRALMRYMAAFFNKPGPQSC